jgi:acetyl-CoA carboxylase carboxyl transferase subunit beta
MEPQQEERGRAAREKLAEIPAGLWQKCTRCSQMLYQKELERDLWVCQRCSYHFRLSAPQRIAITADENSFQGRDADLVSTNPLSFPEYEERLSRDQKKTGLAEAFVWGECAIAGIPAILGASEPGFLMGSMGSVVGEKVTRAMEEAARRRLPFVCFSASGGARMHEGLLSLMQMAKTAAAARRLHETPCPFMSVFTDPTTAGVYASYASLGDILIAEPGALVGFAGRRVIEQGLRTKINPESQTAEFHLENGLIDMIVHRKDMKQTIAMLLRLLL